MPKKKKQRPINTSIPKLRVKYKWMTDQWRKITDIIKVGSGKSPVNEPEWFKILAPISQVRPVFIPVALNSQTFNASGRLRRLLV